MSLPAGLSAAESLKEKKQAKQVWARLLKDGLDADSWGQSIEATEQYEKLARMLEMQVPELGLTAEEQSLCMKLAHSVALRMHTLNGVEAAINDGHSSAQQGTQKLSLDEVKALQPVLDDLFVRSASESFPIQLRNYTASVPKKEGGGGDVFIAHEDCLEKEERGSLLMPPQVRSGQTTLSIVLDKIGLKDAQTYLNSFISVSLTASSGAVVETQDTPHSNTLKPNYVIFGHTVHIQTTLEEILSRDLCLFFEFKHYKPAKKKVSTRCFALMESRELNKAKGQQVCLELYKKPTDFSRRTLNLFTVKQLYLHCTVQVTKH